MALLWIWLYRLPKFQHRMLPKCFITYAISSLAQFVERMPELAQLPNVLWLSDLEIKNS